MFAEAAKATNDVASRVLHVIDTVGHVSDGDLGELDAYRAIGNGVGKRSENDRLVPAMIRVMESLQALVSDTEMLAAAAVAGRLDTRADVSKHKGEYRNVVEGVNDTLDAIVRPVNEAAESLEESRQP